MRHAAVRFALALVLVALTSSAAGQGASETVPRGAFGEVIDVRLIDVEVVVTDRKGNRVSGLGQEDFRLFVDGEEVPVAFFDEVRGGTLVAGEPAEGEPGDGEVRSRVAFEEPPGISYLVFLDDYFAHAKDRNRVLAGLLDDLGDLGPDDRLSIVAYDGRSLDLLLPWSRDGAEIAAAVAVAGKRKGSIASVEQRNVFDAHALAKRIADQLRRTYGAVASTLRAHADAPGRRVALLVSGGWPYDSASAIFGANLSARSPRYDARAPIFQLADVANSTGFTLYTVDAAGNERRPRGDVDRDAVNRPEDADFAAAMAAVLSAATGGGESQGVIDVAAPSLGSGGEALGSASLGADEARFQQEDAIEFEKESTLLVLAELTGGRAMINSQRVDALARAAADVRDYYWLGFHHQRSGDGENRTVRVEVAGRPELEVRSRRGFVDLSPSAEARLVTERALLFGETPEGSAELAVELGPARGGGRHVELPFRVTIPLAELTLAEAADGVHAKLELQVAVEDDRGHRSELAAIPMDLVLTREEAAGGEIVYDAALKVRRRPHDLVFTVADATTGRTLVSRVGFVP